MMCWYVSIQTGSTTYLLSQYVLLIPNSTGSGAADQREPQQGVEAYFYSPFESHVQPYR